MHNKLYNSCLNLKISIDINGYIKNCPSLNDCYENISNNSLKDALANTKFKLYWDISKDKVDVCKDCELRYACNDRRANRINHELYSKPLKCSYEPYKLSNKEVR